MKKFLILAMLVLALVPFASAQEQEKVDILFFYSPGCPHCATLETYLAQLDEKYDDINIKAYDTSRNQEMFITLQAQAKISQDKWGYVPKVFIGDSYCIGDTPCINSIEGMVEKARQNATIPGNGSEEPVQSLNALKLVSLAVADAFNPCELAVLLILLTAILTRYPKEKKKVLLSGFLFTLAIYLVYFCFGALIIFGFKSLTSFTDFSSGWIYKGLGIFAIVLGLVNLKDFFKPGALGFVSEIPVSWRPRMKQIIHSVTSPKGAFFVGIIVSFFLTPCTAGPYFVAGGILAGIPWAAAIPWLIFYNLIFVLPMILITLIVYAGFSTVEKISGWRDKNVRFLHLAVGLIMIALGVVILFNLL